jgi:hypothetical protein
LSQPASGDGFRLPGSEGVRLVELGQNKTPERRISGPARAFADKTARRHIQPDQRPYEQTWGWHHFTPQIVTVFVPAHRTCASVGSSIRTPITSYASSWLTFASGRCTRRSACSSHHDHLMHCLRTYRSLLRTCRTSCSARDDQSRSSGQWCALEANLRASKSALGRSVRNTRRAIMIVQQGVFRQRQAR